MLRPTLPEDHPALLEMTEQTDFFLPHEIETLGAVLEDFQREGDQSGHVCQTFLNGDRPTGFVYYAPNEMTDRTWELWWIVVSPTSQGQGIGSRLLTLVEQDLVAQAGRLLVIETSSLPLYESTRRFYAKNGYREVARIPDFYRDGDDKVIFSKCLKPTEPA